jgi:hypothetical protein
MLLKIISFAILNVASSASSTEAMTGDHIPKTDNNMEKALKWWLKEQDTDFCGHGIRNTLHHKGLHLHRDYTEKQFISHSVTRY